MKRILALWAFVLAACTPVMAHAAEKNIDAFGDAGREVEFWAPTGAGIFLLLRLLKDPRLAEGIGKLVPKTWGPPVVAAVIGQLAAAAYAYSIGMDWRSSLVLGAFVAGEAVLIHVYGIDVGRRGKEVLWPKDEPNPEPPKNPPPIAGDGVPPPTTTTLGMGRMMLGWFALLVVSCTSDPLVDASTAHKHATTVVNGAGDLLEKKCVTPMEELAARADKLRESIRDADPGDSAAAAMVAASKAKLTEIADLARKLDALCNVALLAYDQAQAAVTVLGAALTAAAVNDWSRLPAALASASEAVIRLSQAITQVTLK